MQLYFFVMQINCHGSTQYKLSWHSLAPLVKMKTISTAGGVLPIMAYTGGGGEAPPKEVPFQALVGKYMKGQGFH